LDNNEPLATAVAGIRYTLPEAGGIILLPTNAEIVDEYLSQVWPYWWVQMMGLLISFHRFVILLY
jgi:hypothetical protein